MTKRNSEILKVLMPAKMKEELKLVAWADGITMTDKVIMLVTEELEKRQSEIKELKALRSS